MCCTPTFREAELIQHCINELDTTLHAQPSFRTILTCENDRRHLKVVRFIYDSQSWSSSWNTQVEIRTVTDTKAREVKLPAGTSPTALSFPALARRFYLQRPVTKSTTLPHIKQNNITFLNEAATTLDPSANLRTNQGIQDGPDSLSLLSLIYTLKQAGSSFGTHPTIVRQLYQQPTKLPLLWKGWGQHDLELNETMPIKCTICKKQSK